MSILMEDVSFSYGDKNILRQTSMSVNQGEYVGIVGVSGGGKSTLLKLLSGLYQPQTGRIVVENAKSLQQIRKLVAIVMQSSFLFPATIKENITCGHIMDEASIKTACDAAQLSEWIATLPDGINTFVGERGNKVSGGQAQRICIARAIVKNAPIILLDEATSALDNYTSKAVLLALSNLTLGKTVIHVSHRPELLDGCNRVLKLEGGRLYDT